MVATLMADLRDAGLRDVVLRDVVGWSGAASKGAAEAMAFTEGSAGAANKDDPINTNGWHDKSASRFLYFEGLLLVQDRLRGLDGAAIARTATSGAERRKVNLGSAGHYARSYDVVHDDAAGAASDRQAMAG